MCIHLGQHAHSCTSVCMLVWPLIVHWLLCLKLLYACLNGLFPSNCAVDSYCVVHDGGGGGGFDVCVW